MGSPSMSPRMATTGPAIEATTAKKISGMTAALSSEM